jgi:hypothetical protein
MTAEEQERHTPKWCNLEKALSQLSKIYMPPPFSNFYARDISKYYEWKRRILKRERLEWLQEVKERNARSEEGKRREAQEKLRKEN